MRKRIVHILDVPAGGLLSALAVTSVSFALGGLAGCLLAAIVGGGGNDSLTLYIQSYLKAVESGGAEVPALLPVLWETLRWPAMVVLLGFTALGVLGIPVLFAARGFFLSFAVASFVRMFGGVGAILAFFSFGITGVIAVPALFVLGVQGFLTSKNLAGRVLGDGKRTLPFNRTYFIRCGLCALALGLCILLECFAVPALLRSAASLF